MDLGKIGNIPDLVNNARMTISIDQSSFIDGSLILKGNTIYEIDEDINAEEIIIGGDDIILNFNDHIANLQYLRIIEYNDILIKSGKIIADYSNFKTDDKDKYICISYKGLGIRLVDLHILVLRREDQDVCCFRGIASNPNTSAVGIRNCRFIMEEPNKNNPNNGSIINLN